MVLLSFGSQDVLGCGAKSDPLLANLFGRSRKVLQYTLSFINALASEGLGRTYLLQKRDLIDMLVNILYSEKGDTLVRQNALGAL